MEDGKNNAKLKKVPPQNFHPVLGENDDKIISNWNLGLTL